MVFSYDRERMYTEMKRFYAYMLKLGTLTFAAILVCVIISNLSLTSPNWPFGLVASFSDSLMIILPAVIGASFLSWRKAVLPLVLLALIAFYPVYSFKNFVTPTQADCTAIDCLSIVAVNLRHHPDALSQLAQSQAKDADILLISELPHGATSESLQSLFPMVDQATVPLITDAQLQLGSRLALISRKPLKDVALQIEAFPVSKLRPRGIVTFKYVWLSGDELSFGLVHAPPPKGRLETASRDAYLRAASGRLSNSANFVLIGDFNMTPWEPEFSALAGQRAGDPRWRRTWNARKFWQRISIDHALIGEDVNLVEFEVLDDVGSDHFPIRIIVHPG